MSHESKQRIIQAEFFSDKGGGKFNVETYPFVLKEHYRLDNLYDGIAEDAIKYFNDNRIGWWRGKEGKPTNHTLSSQIACVNHLYWINKNPGAATMILKEIDPELIALPFPETNNFVEFELNGCDANHGNYLGESGKTRGANSTSIDAAMLASKGDRIILVFIEWKYVERYYEKPNKAMQKSNYEARKNTYKHFLTDDESPIILDRKCLNSKCDYDSAYGKFSVEPFYQLMRQTLLAWRLTQEGRYGATDYIHVHVIPDSNETLMNGKTSIAITEGHNNICDGWRTFVKEPVKYKHLDPKSLICNAAEKYDKNLYEYLNNRYWK